MSAESGISTFRDSNGLWENYSIHEVATPEAWEKDPDLVTLFYNERRKNIIATKPNSAHFEIAHFENDTKWKVSVITQNIDDLHERAGSTNVLHLHGNIFLSKSSGPNSEKAYYPIEGWELNQSNLCPDGYRLRPHVVWFGEDVPNYPKAAEIIYDADVLIVIGTSLQVQPAASLINFAKTKSIKYIVDPKANELSVPSDFIVINKFATEGINQALNEIKKRFQ